MFTPPSQFTHTYTLLPSATLCRSRSEDLGGRLERQEEPRLVLDHLAEQTAGLQPFAVLWLEIPGLEAPTTVHHRGNEARAMEARDQCAITATRRLDQFIGHEFDRGLKTEGGLQFLERGGHHDASEDRGSQVGGASCVARVWRYV